VQEGIPPARVAGAKPPDRPQNGGMVDHYPASEKRSYRLWRPVFAP
jgi:hypothetical protein